PLVLGTQLAQASPPISLRDTAPVMKHDNAGLPFRLLGERRAGPSSEFTSIYETCVELGRPAPYPREDLRRSEMSRGARRIQTGRQTHHGGSYGNRSQA